MEIRSIIREILTQHDFVSLPGIGSFIQKYESAKLSVDGTSLLPPKQKVVFDTSRVFNDEAIENYICKTTGVNHQKAAELLAESIAEINNLLNQNQEVAFENIGTLKKDANGIVQFKSVPEDDLASSTFGLKFVTTGKPSTSIVTPKEQKPPVKHIETKKVKKLKTLPIIIYSSIAVLVILALIFTMVPGLQFWQFQPDQELVNKADEAKQSSTPVDFPDEAQKVDENVSQTIESKTNKKSALFYEEPKIQDNKTFYIIAGSFSVIENAQRLSDSFKQKGFSTEILQGEDMYRVSIFKTTDRNFALNELSKLRNDNPNEKFWLLGL